MTVSLLSFGETCIHVRCMQSNGSSTHKERHYSPLPHKRSLNSKQIFRRVTARLDHLTNIDQRQQKATALLLLLSDDKTEAGEIRQMDTDILGGPSSHEHCSERTQHREAIPRAASFVAGEPARQSNPFSGKGVKKIFFSATGERRRRRRKRVESISGCGTFSGGCSEGSRNIGNGEGNIARFSRKTDGGWGHSRNRLTSAGDGSGCNTLQAITPSVRFAVCRDIARVRIGRKRMSDGVSFGFGGGVGGVEQPPPPSGQLTAEEARRAMFGFCPQLGRYSEREDRWL